MAETVRRREAGSLGHVLLSSGPAVWPWVGCWLSLSLHVIESQSGRVLEITQSNSLFTDGR